MKPVLFVTSHAPPDRIGAFIRLHELENVHFALFGGRSKHASATIERPLPFPHHRVHQRDLPRLILCGNYRAVICSTGGRVALPLAWSAARSRRLPVILWCSIWAHPRSAVHALSYLALRRLYRSADALVTYGPHVSSYVRARGARNVFIAPQSVDNEFWRVPVAGEQDAAQVRFLFVGRPDPEKGLAVLLRAWHQSGLRPPSATLTLVGATTNDIPAADGVRSVGWAQPDELRNFYAQADVLVVPSIATSTFREPWGLVINEAMNQRVAVIASDAVGAVAGGLVRDGHNGLVYPHGNRLALAETLRKLAADRSLGSHLGAAGAADVLAYTHQAWAGGFSESLASLDLSQRDC